MDTKVIHQAVQDFMNESGLRLTDDERLELTRTICDYELRLEVARGLCQRELKHRQSVTYNAFYGQLLDDFHRIAKEYALFKRRFVEDHPPKLEEIE